MTKYFNILCNLPCKEHKDDKEKMELMSQVQIPANPAASTSAEMLLGKVGICLLSPSIGQITE